MIKIKPNVLQRRNLEVFDVNNRAHRHAYYHFRKTGKWGAKGCPFEIRWPFLSTPSMCEHDIFEYFIQQELGDVYDPASTQYPVSGIGVVAAA